MPSLQEDLAEQLNGFNGRASAEVRTAFAGQIEELRASGAEAGVLAPGSMVPDLTLPDALGRPVRLSALRPAVIVFYRGGWCPYCNLELRHWQKALPALAELGGQLVAISPQEPDGSLSTAEKNGLEYPVLSDRGGVAARAFGLEFELPPALQAIYRERGNDLAAINAETGWRLPMPGTFAVGADGRIVLADADADYRKRPEPAEVLAALRLALGKAA